MRERTAFMLAGALTVAVLYTAKAVFGEGGAIIVTLVIIAFSAVALNREDR